MVIITGTGYIEETNERRENDYDIGSRDFVENFSPPDTMNSDEENSESTNLFPFFLFFLSLFLYCAPLLSLGLIS